MSAQAVRPDTAQHAASSLLTSAHRVLAAWDEQGNNELLIRTNEYLYARIGDSLSSRYAAVHLQFNQGVADPSLREILLLGSFAGINLAVSHSPLRNKLRSLGLQLLYMQFTLNDCILHFNSLALTRTELVQGVVTRVDLRRLTTNPGVIQSQLTNVDALLANLSL